MNILGCLDTPTNGDYFLDGENVAGLNEKKLAEIRNRELGFVFQGFNLISGMDAVENVELPLLYRGIPAARRRSLALNALDRVGLSERVNHMPDEMSGAPSRQSHPLSLRMSRPEIWIQSPAKPLCRSSIPFTSRERRSF